MSMKSTSKNGTMKCVAISMISFFVICALLHKPLPAGFTKTKLDRIIMHLVEPALRAAYYYPSRMFSKASSMVWWTRHTLDNLSKVLGVMSTVGKDLRVDELIWNGVLVRVYVPRSNYTATGGAVILIHGGGFALGSVEMYDGLVRRMVSEMNTLFVSIEYRLVPETVFPGPILDCEAAIDYFFEHGDSLYDVDLTRVVVMGDSAGGNLATVVAQRRVARRAQPALVGQVLIYPLLQMADMQTVSYRYFSQHLTGYALVDPESVAYYYMFYAGINMDEKAYLVKDVVSNGHVSKKHQAKISKFMEHGNHIEVYDNYENSTIPNRWTVEPNEEAQQLLEPYLTNPDFSPLMREDLSELPKTMVLTCEFDVLRDEGIMYAERLKDAGVPTTFINYKNGFHAMLNFHNELWEAQQTLTDIMDWTVQTINN